MQLNEICELIIDCEHKTAPTQEAGHPSIRTPNIGRGYFILENVNRVSQETYEQWTKRAIPQAGDLIMAREAPVGNVAMIPEGLMPCLGQRTLLIRPDKNKVNPAYLTYLLIGPDVQGLIHSKTNGATVAHLNMKDVRQLELPQLPDRKIQDEISEILSAYDSLIENNNRRIVILENMAQSLYREWFVNFRFPGYENCKFVDSVLGRVPEGWEVKRLFDISEATYGCAFKSSLFNSDGNGAPVVRIRDINNNATKTYTPEKPKKIEQILRNGDLLIGMDGDFHMGKWAGGHALLNQRVVKISAKTGYSPYFVFLSMKKPISELNKAIVGTTVAHLGDSHLREVLVFDPGNKLMEMANSLLDSIFLQEINLRVRNCNLKRQRDMLLPRLVSGQIELDA